MDPIAAQPAGAESQVQPPSVDINTLAALVQKFQQQNAPAAQAPGAGKNTANNSSSGAAAAAEDKKSSGDAQSMMEQIAELTKSLEAEKAKSKTLQEEKKREMKGFLNGIRDYVNGLEGVKDPSAKQTFMQGIENMANHGIPNGVYDIMVSASAQNLENMKTIEALTKGYTTLKDKYEGPGQFAQESSRFVDPTLKIVDAGSKRKQPEQVQDKVPLGMWDAFGDDIAKVGYLTQRDLFAN